MKVIEGFLNEKGNVSATHRALVREQVAGYICNNTDFIASPNGTYYLHVADAADNTPIYAVIDLSITVADPTIVKEKKAKAPKEKEIVEIPELF